jgi:hypothetical protein
MHHLANRTHIPRARDVGTGVSPWPAHTSTRGDLTPPPPTEDLTAGYNEIDSDPFEMLSETESLPGPETYTTGPIRKTRRRTKATPPNRPYPSTTPPSFGCHSPAATQTRLTSTGHVVTTEVGETSIKAAPPGKQPTEDFETLSALPYKWEETEEDKKTNPYCFKCEYNQTVAEASLNTVVLQLDELWANHHARLYPPTLCRMIQEHYNELIKPSLYSEEDWTPKSIFLHYTKHNPQRRYRLENHMKVCDQIMDHCVDHMFKIGKESGKKTIDIDLCDRYQRTNAQALVTEKLLQSMKIAYAPDTSV